MKSFTTPEFWDLYAALPPEAREQAKKAYRLGRENQFHPSLHFKKVGDNLWSVRVSRGYRALALSRGEDYY
ncbi:hypothetical protein PI95_022750 [Hassallia byssoidea VB512170]|uniref:Uncharacterized protein n=1 Tax=Hassallia byssoidea VB512170 TaxID=1304833 RepID=A0A846HCM1_9CYAN|nr:hypothetical protein [Hassalia byssoidea]NEU75297.1 hypothetical protein [Hassalia byssoidea VB512170]